MRIKKYTAPTMREALLKIKEELGENAVILKTRRLPKKIFALGGQAPIEVTAAIDDDQVVAAEALPKLALSNPGVYTRPSGKRMQPQAAFPEPLVSKGRNNTPASTASAPRMDSEESLRLVEIKEDIRELKELIKSIVQTSESKVVGGFSGGWAVLYKQLVDAEVRPEVATDLINRIHDTNQQRDPIRDTQLMEILSTHCPVSGPLRRRPDEPLVVVFVGPTGAGKTTTLAKLVAHAVLNQKYAISIIAADTYRIAAIEQIRTFADIVNVGLHVVFSPDEVAAALAACENDDIVFVDTAGRSQKNSEHMKELGQYLGMLKPHECNLVLSATTKDSDLDDTIERYKGLGVNRLLFTKLDETVKYGNILNAVTRHEIPLSYFTVGQRVPDDIELVNPARFIQRLWKGLAW
jgi:flagellar biosynthesis protein FlhF